jgi:Ca-activated chloride channel family protein
VRRVGEILDQIDLNGANDELVKELVSLSLKHGIMTPYTSFLADETAAHRDLASTTAAANDRLQAFNQNAEGSKGFEQRVAKESYRSAPNAAAAPMSLQLGSVGGAAGPASAAPAQSYFNAVAGEKEEAAKVVQNVRQVGNKAFYRRGESWVDSIVTADQQKQTIAVARFSSEYFSLIDKHGRDVAKYLATDEPVVLEIDGRTYEVK